MNVNANTNLGGWASSYFFNKTGLKVCRDTARFPICFFRERFSVVGLKKPMLNMTNKKTDGRQFPLAATGLRLVWTLFAPPHHRVAGFAPNDYPKS